jgi:UDP-hydrolysing UDP-N-acetyl-D-glucosamine 2-epimerase
MKRKICVISGTRADYGLFLPLLKEITATPSLELQIVATGMHLSPEFGLTYRQIEADGFRVDRKVEMLLSADSPEAIVKSMGLCQISIADALSDLKPDIVVILGDRFETFAASSAASVMRIPIAHLHGGEVTEGAIDESFRHAITKMSYWHFTSNLEHRNRVIQLGESPERVFDVGALAIDNILNMNLLSRSELETDLGLKFGGLNLLVTFHPATQEHGAAQTQFAELLAALEDLPEARVVFTKPNADTDGRVLMPMIDQFVSRHATSAVAHTSLGTRRYLSTVKAVDAVVGNSSSGIIEVPYFGIATVDIGDRQKGRLRPRSVLSCAPERVAILDSIRKGISPEFRSDLKGMELPYGNGGAARLIRDTLAEVRIPGDLKKSFHDLKV